MQSVGTITLRPLTSIQALRKHLPATRPLLAPNSKTLSAPREPHRLPQTSSPSTTSLLYSRGGTTPSVKRRCDDAGLWSHDASGSPVTARSSLPSILRPSVPAWLLRDELADALHAEVQDPLHDRSARGVYGAQRWLDASCILPR